MCITYTETPTTKVEPETFLGKALLKALSPIGASVIEMITPANQDTRQKLMKLVIHEITQVMETLDISIQPRTTKKQKKHKKAGTDEYDNPKDSTSEYWNANWIAGWYVCLFR